MTRNKFLSMWAGLLAAVGVGKAQTDMSVPLEHGLWTSIPYRHHVYPPNRCPVCGTEGPEPPPPPTYETQTIDRDATLKAHESVKSHQVDFVVMKTETRPAKETTIQFGHDFVPLRLLAVCPTCGNMWVRQEPPLRIDGEEK